MFDNVVCVRDTDKFGVHDILDDVLEENEHSAEPDHSDAEHDSVQTAAKVEKGSQAVHHLDH